MKTPFTTSQFLEIFRVYNETVFPIQVVFYLLGVIIVYLAIKTSPRSDRIISVLLAFFWLWMGVIYHWLLFTSINKLAYIFGALFVIQGMLFLYFGFFHQKITFRYRKDIYGITGLIFIVYALMIYPLIGAFGDHAYPYSPTFGLPCPTTIFTFGMILLSDKKFPILLLVIPFLWSILGVSAAINFGIIEDTFLVIAGFATVLLVFFRNKKYGHSTQVLTN